MSNKLAKKVKRILILVSILVITVSIIFLKMGINSLNQRSYLREVCTEQTIGIVYDFIMTGSVTEDGNGYQDNRMYRPLFKYDVKGKVYILESEFGTATKRFQLWQEVVINYNPDEPAESYVPEDRGGESGPYLLIGLAGILLILDIFALIRFSFQKEFD